MPDDRRPPPTPDDADAVGDPASSPEGAPPAAADPADPSAAASDAGPIPPLAPDEVVAEAERLRATVASLEDRIRRQQAEFVNDTRRMQRQADERVRFAAQGVVEDLLGVADALHGAIEQLGPSEHEQRVAHGLRMVEKELLDSLGRHGVARIDALNKPFDPAYHQAVMEVESPASVRTVVQVVRPGFTLHGRVVRPAHVIVSKPREPREPREPQEPQEPKESTGNEPESDGATPAPGETR